MPQTTERRPEDYNPVCSFRDCWEDAFVIDPTTGEGWCPEDFEVMLDRWEALAIAPTMRATLPAPDDR
jgi:hypothetical protein